MKIVMPCDNLSTNGYTRAYPFAKLMSEDYNVTVVGPVEEQGIFKPLKNDTSIKYKLYPYKKIFPFYFQNAKNIYKDLNADIIHSFKITFPSFLPALIKKIKNKNQKLILDIDDWESQYMLDNYLSPNPINLAKFTFADLYVPESYFLKKALEKQSKKADAIITSSKTLQKMFGGTWIPTGPNTDYFNPENFSGNKIREELDLKGKTVVLFSGTPKKHKGILELMQAINEINNEDIHLLIIGADKNNPITKQLKNSKLITVLEQIDNKELPNYMKASDIFCAPQWNSKSANAQLPIKIFEPMSMELPVITTNISDMQEIFQNCGTVIEPNNTEALKKAILNYIDNKELRTKHGIQARKECLEKYSWKIMKQKTKEIYESLSPVTT